MPFGYRRRHAEFLQWVLHSELYAIPALIGAGITVVAALNGFASLPAALVAASVCFLVRLLGVRFGISAPSPPPGATGG